MVKTYNFVYKNKNMWEMWEKWETMQINIVNKAFVEFTKILKSGNFVGILWESEVIT